MENTEEQIIGQVVINVFENNVFSVGTSFDLEETVELLDAAIYSIEEGELDGLDVFQQSGGTIQ